MEEANVSKMKKRLLHVHNVFCLSSESCFGKRSKPNLLTGGPDSERDLGYKPGPTFVRCENSSAFLTHTEDGRFFIQEVGKGSWSRLLGNRFEPKRFSISKVYWDWNSKKSSNLRLSKWVLYLLSYCCCCLYRGGFEAPRLIVLTREGRRIWGGLFLCWFASVVVRTPPASLFWPKMEGRRIWGAMFIPARLWSLVSWRIRRYLNI